MPNPSEGEGPVAEAARRLDQALSALEARLTGPARRAAPSTGAAGLEGQTDLIEALQAAEAREQALEEAAREASAALGRAVADVRAALGEEEFEPAEEAHA